MIGYATFYTMAPVFSLVLDRDVNEDVALLYPELYKELTKVSFERDEALDSFEVSRDARMLTSVRCLSRRVDHYRTRRSSLGR